VRDHLAGWLPEGIRLLLIENVGNLVCPASYDLGESARIVLASVTEGEDKPVKYPTAYRWADEVALALLFLRAGVEELLTRLLALTPEYTAPAHTTRRT
jgi:hydrogenase nickel incorporation protein HypB